MTPELQALARQVARQRWARARHEGAFDYDDLLQEALLAAWQVHPTDPDRGDGLRVVVAHRRVIDFMRRVCPLNGPRVMSLDAEDNDGRCRQVADPHGQDDYDHTEAVLVLRRLIADYPGARRDAEAVWLSVHGFDDAEVAAHQGVGARRVCERRARFVAWVRAQLHPDE